MICKTYITPSKISLYSVKIISYFTKVQKVSNEVSSFGLFFKRNKDSRYLSWKCVAFSCQSFIFVFFRYLDVLNLIFFWFFVRRSIFRARAMTHMAVLQPPSLLFNRFWTYPRDFRTLIYIWKDFRFVFFRTRLNLIVWVKSH